MRFSKTAFVSHPLRIWGGAEYHLKVAANIFNSPTIYTAWYSKELIEEHFGSATIKTSYLQKFPTKEKYYREITPLLPSAYSHMRISEDHDLIVALTDGFEKLIKMPVNSLKVAYILTPPKFLWMSDRSMQRSSSKLYKFYDKYLSDSLHDKWRRSDLDAISHYDHLIANSAAVRSRIAKFYNRDSVIVHPPVDVDKMKYNRKYSSREDWFLYFGRVESYKGVEMAIRASAKLGFKLKVAGTGSDLERMKQLVEDLGIKHQVGFLGFVSEKMKKELLFKCRGLISPVIEEDFGIVPVEANASGVAVIAFRSGGAMETIKEGESGVFFDEYTVDSLSEVIEKFDRMSFDPEICRKQAMNFSADTFRNKLKSTLDGFSKG